MVTILTYGTETWWLQFTLSDAKHLNIPEHNPNSPKTKGESIAIAAIARAMGPRG